MSALRTYHPLRADASVKPCRSTNDCEVSDLWVVEGFVGAKF